MPGKEIIFEATVAQLKTLVDGGIRVTFDLSETAIKQAADLMECKRRGVVLSVRIGEDHPNRRGAKRGRPN